MDRALKLILVEKAGAVGAGNAGVVGGPAYVRDVVKRAAILVDDGVRVGTAAVAMAGADTTCCVWPSEM
jgi:hypothetical protein